MSRYHAEIEADLKGQASKALHNVSRSVVNTTQVVNIRDSGSMHGTFLNDEMVSSKESRPLVNGDKITFGVSVFRNQAVFEPATMTVGVEFQNGLVMHFYDTRKSTHPLMTTSCQQFSQSCLYRSRRLLD